MEIKSRVKKYEQVRSGIQDVKADSTFIKQLFTNEEDEDTKLDYTPSRQKKSVKENDTFTEENTSFKNEYLDSFIQEVKEYNIQKGNRYHEDTQLDILEQLKSKNNDKRTRYIEKEETVYNTVSPTTSDDEVISNEQISQQIFNLLGTQSTMTSRDEQEKIDDIVIVDEKLEERISTLESQLEKTVDFAQEILKQKKELEESNESKESLLEKTTQIKVEMEEYKEELTGLNKEVDSNNRLLNVIITIQVLALLGIIGAVIYWLVSGGVI